MKILDRIDKSRGDSVTESTKVNAKSDLGIKTDLRTKTEQEALEQRIFTKYELQNTAADLLPGWRVEKCMRHRVSADSPVEVVYRPGEQTASYSNLMRCGSVWVCPICMSIESEKRREVLNEQIEWWKKNQNDVAMLTLTMQHSSIESCETILTSLNASLSAFWRYRKGQDIQKHYRIMGKIRAIEPLLGENGWHIHFHIILFIEGHLQPSEVASMQEAMAHHWRHVLEKHNRFADLQHGCKITSNEKDMADYVCKLGKENTRKWTLSHEVTNSHKKLYEQGSLTPINLLEAASFGDALAKVKFIEYAKAFKGKQQLHYSKGLKALLNALIPAPDSETEDPEEEITTMLIIYPSAWGIICKNAIRGELLAVCSRGDPYQVLDYLSDMEIHQGIFIPALPEVKFDYPVAPYAV